VDGIEQSPCGNVRVHTKIGEKGVNREAEEKLNGSRLDPKGENQIKKLGTKRSEIAVGLSRVLKKGQQEGQATPRPNKRHRDLKRSNERFEGYSDRFTNTSDASLQRPAEGGTREKTKKNTLVQRFSPTLASGRRKQHQVERGVQETSGGEGSSSEYGERRDRVENRKTQRGGSKKGVKWAKIKKQGGTPSIAYKLPPFDHEWVR